MNFSRFFPCLFRKMPAGLLLLNLSMLSGCATNPATKNMEFMIVSEEKEFKIGQGVDKQVREDMGVYLELPELRSFVKKMVNAIGRQSDRPELTYRLEIIDTPDFNAFAVPGGFIYVHRGLLERMNSSDELASVLGHEIAHVSVRHSAAQISKSQLLNIGLIGLAVATEGTAQDFGQLIKLGSALAFNKFSRDDEREADHFGTEYSVRAGYNPKASIDVMKQIQKLHERAPSTFAVWFMTHPATSERIANLTRDINAIQKEQPEILERPIKRNEWITLLDGLAIGEWNGSELIKGDHYYNKEYLLSLKIPAGWLSQLNSKQYTSVFFHPQKKFFTYFNIEPLQPRKRTEDYYRDFENYLNRAGLKKNKDVEPDRQLPHGALAGVFTGSESSLGPIMAEAIAFTKDANGYSLTCICKKDDFTEFQPLAESIGMSLKFISQEEAAKLEPERMRIHKVKTGETWKGITSKYFGSSMGMNKLADYNGLKISQDLSAGDFLKIPPTLHIR